MTILIAYDGSDDARAALGYAARRLRPEPTVVITVWEPLLTQFTWAPLAAATDASIIVTGSRGLAGARSLILGSVSTRVLRHARRPVLVVPPPNPEDGTG